MLARIFAIAASALGFVGLATSGLAEPRVSIFYDTQYLCQPCGGTFNYEQQKTYLTGLFPNLKTIPSAAPATLVPALGEADVVIFPHQFDKSLADVILPESVNALREFVRMGGRLIFKNDFSQPYLKNLVAKIFDLQIVAQYTYGLDYAFTCDSALASELGWSGAPEPGTMPFFTLAQSQLVTGMRPICTSMNDSLLVAAYPYGDGVVYFEGMSAATPQMASPAQNQLFREMVEADLLPPHRCFVGAGALKCGGNNSHGQLGQGDGQIRIDTFRNLPAVSLGQGFAAMRVEDGGGTSCALSAAGQLKCWGMNKDGKLLLGDTRDRGAQPNEMGDQLAPLDFAGDAIKDFSVGAGHVCAVGASGKLYCWGKGQSGQLGSERAATVGAAVGDRAVVVNLPEPVKSVRAGYAHTCALLASGKVACFGDNRSGQLGTGDAVNVGDRPGTMGEALKTVDLGRGFVATSLAGGRDHNCALSDAGQVKCWGSNGSGQLGQGAAVGSRGTRPEELGEALPFTDLGEAQFARALACGGHHCCAVTLSHTMKCWGANGGGQLGLGDVASRGRRPEDMGDQLPFLRFPSGEMVEALTLAGDSTCAKTASGTRCWGRNASGQLATGDRTDRGGTPASVPALLAPTF